MNSRGERGGPIDIARIKPGDGRRRLGDCQRLRQMLPVTAVVARQSMHAKRPGVYVEHSRSGFARFGLFPRAAHRPLGPSQTFTVPSSLALARRLPSGLKATRKTLSV